MKNPVIQCLFVGNISARYPDLKGILKDVAERDVAIHISETDLDDHSLKNALGHLSGANLIFANSEDFALDQSNGDHTQTGQSDRRYKPFYKRTLQSLLDRIWQWVPDAMVVLLDSSNTVQAETDLHIPDDLVFSRLSLTDQDRTVHTELRILLQTARLKYEFRQCKRLLGMSEKRSQWLLDTSKEAVAYISRDIHLYANQAYLDLFGLPTQAALRSLPVSDIVVAEQVAIFQDYLRSQLVQGENSPMHVITLQRRDGSRLRGKIRAIPAVLKGKRCLQLWVYAYHDVQQDGGVRARHSDGGESRPQSNTPSKKTTRLSENNHASEEAVKSIWYGEESQNAPGSPSASLPANTGLLKRPVDTGTLMREILARDDTRLFSLVLTSNNPVKLQKGSQNSYYMIGLRVPFIQRKAVDELLIHAYGGGLESARALFWDKIKLIRLFDLLAKKQLSEKRLVVRLTTVTVQEPRQRLWLESRLKQLHTKARMLVFMLPATSTLNERRQQVEFARSIMRYGCRTGLDNFQVNHSLMNLLNQIRPDVVRFSNDWLRAIEGVEKREYALSQFIRELEKRGIRVIVPCGFSLEMNRLFILSGASFCQKKTSKNE